MTSRQDDVGVARDRLAVIHALRAKADDAYHDLDAPIMDDAEYDGLKREQEALEARFPSLSAAPSVGAVPSSGFTKASHGLPMLSLRNAFTTQDVRSFHDLVRKAAEPGQVVRFCSEWKMDGLSLNILYVDGVLTRALTRGQGTTGEDVTANARVISDIPHKLSGHGLPSMVEVRGEVYMSKDGFLALIARQEAAGDKKSANPRNAAAGALRQHDPAVTAARGLMFSAYAMGAMDWESPSLTQESLLAQLHTWGFKVGDVVMSDNWEGLVQAHVDAALRRSSLPWDVDGIVHKVDCMSLRQKLGEAATVPRWAVAHKFEAERAITVVRGILIQVGRTGTLTPVADLAPVNVGGVLVSRATLHNLPHVLALDLRVGDTVSLFRSGDVIPRIEHVLLAHRPLGTAPFSMPVHCPVCGGHVREDVGGVVTRCTNGLSCPAQVVERICHVVSRDILDIDGLGEGSVESLVKVGLLRTPADIYRLHRHADTMRHLEGWGERSVSMLLAAVEARRSVPLGRFLASLGVREVGRTTGQRMAQRFKSWEAFRSIAIMAGNNTASSRELLSVEGVGDVVLGEVAAFFSNPVTLAGVDDICSEVRVLDHEGPVDAATSGSPIHGLSIAFSGSMERMTRPEARAHAEARGALTSDGVTRKTHILVHGPGAGSKLAKAESMGVRTMTEEEWWAFTGE